MRNIDFHGFEVLDSDTFVSRQTFYVDIELDATTEELAEAADGGLLFAAPDYEVISGSDEFSLGTFKDTRTNCQVDLGVVRPGPPAQLYVAIVCPS